MIKLKFFQKNLIKDVTCLCNTEYISTLSNDLNSLFCRYSKSIQPYKIKHFKLKEARSPSGDEFWLKNNNDIARTIITTKRIDFTDGYFKFNEKQRHSIFLHEICHFLIYSKKKLCDLALSQNTTNNFDLRAFQEYLADLVMFRRNKDLFELRFEINHEKYNDLKKTQDKDRYEILIDVLNMIKDENHIHKSRFKEKLFLFKKMKLKKIEKLGRRFQKH